MKPNPVVIEPYQNTNTPTLVTSKPEVVHVTQSNSQETPKNIQATQVALENTPKVSALSLASIKAKRELEAHQKASVKHHDELPKAHFTETDMLLHWTHFAERLKSKGQHIMATYMLMDDPILDGTVIKLHLPNEGSKVDFETNKNDLLGYLRGKLHNHDVVIEVTVNEGVETKYAFTPLEKYEKLKSMNPVLDLLKKTFDLDV